MRSRSLIRLTSLSVALVLALGATAWAATTVWNATKRETTAATLIGSFRWHEHAPWFGGLSALELTPDGMGFMALTDRSHRLEGQLLRQHGKITGLRILRDERLKAPRGGPMPGNREDSEGLALGEDGTFYVSFEGPHRVLEYRDGHVRALPAPKAFRSFHRNSSFESLAQDAAGRVLLIAEGASRKPDVSRVWIWTRGKGWRGLGGYPEQEGFLPVGADYGPDGALYVLERKFANIGFRSRIRRFSVTPTGLEGGTVLLDTPLGRHSNLEGLSIWRDQSGALRATMVSDDNFLWLLRTDLVEYRLPD
ncbi:esterase-like activity of phytase family protein [Phaeobacter sp. HF9A]|uniref:esterase-like activity of phytase family protein n=1 Tax=Phaeobacter sp. HF9A TaxID=2721561 RepID=UPI00142F6E03|nr:esterase-like activity of phytase family protein [Phaeobacter sp. HF9A]NIZ13858.1 esterase-like activity of phytase family protein [Phaeobacter sp. HF9A]